MLIIINNIIEKKMQLTTQENDLRATEQYFTLDSPFKRFLQFPHLLLVILPVGKTAPILSFALIMCEFFTFSLFLLFQECRN